MRWFVTNHVERNYTMSTKKNVAVVETAGANTETKKVYSTNEQMEAKGLTTKSAKIRQLNAEGMSVSGIAKQVGVIYQHARNVIKQPLKGRATKAVEAVAPAAEEEVQTEG